MRVSPLFIMKSAGLWLFDSVQPEWMKAILSTWRPRFGKISDTILPHCPWGVNLKGDFISPPTSFAKKPVNLLKPGSSWPLRFSSSGL